VSRRRVAVVGAGASGTILALHLLREGTGRVTLVERERTPGRGTAYGTRRPEHVLNVTAARMSVWPDDPGEFARWIASRGGSVDDYARREDFGDYLSGLLEAAGDRIQTIAGEAVAIEPSNGGEQVRLRDGRRLAADAAVLALGNLRPAVPPGIDPAQLGAAFVDDPWYGGFAEGLNDSDTVLLVGTGLTAVDAALTLDALGFRGRIFALSRRGLLPHANLKREPVVEPPEGLTSDPVALLRAVRRRGERIGWREAVHEVRVSAQSLWAAMPLAWRRRFLRHLRPWWDVHRHRIAPSVADGIEALRSDGRFAAAAGRIVSAEPDAEGVLVRWRPRGETGLRELRAARIVNCAGPELDIGRAGEPLLDALIGAGRIRPDPCRLGIDVDRDSRALGRDGAPDERLYAIGPMTRGAFWESIAIADIAAQAQAVARRITRKPA
jgi:uncharacterized NAD(P)/FAD-binding protein YdhS